MSEDIIFNGIKQTVYFVLDILYKKGEQSIQKSGEKVMLASSSITYVVDKLEKKEYLKRKACPKDRRVTYATLTDSGKQLMDDIFPEHAEAIHNIFGVLNATEKEQLIAQLKKLGYYAENC